jgi:hypothetical protein
MFSLKTLGEDTTVCSHVLMCYYFYSLHLNLFSTGILEYRLQDIVTKQNCLVQLKYICRAQIENTEQDVYSNILH